jgi:tRNA(Ile)-lysidine synthase TilS/MesJ
VLKYDKYPQSIIRPLALCEERQIVEFARYKGFESITCTCPYDAASKRKRIRSDISALTGGSSAAKRNIFKSMSHIKTEYMPPEPKGRDHPDSGA